MELKFDSIQNVPTHDVELIHVLIADSGVLYTVVPLFNIIKGGLTIEGCKIGGLLYRGT